MATPPAFDFICPEAERLAGAGPTLYCVRCDRDVHDLSAMTATEAEVFLAGCRGKSLCVRYEQDVATGEVLHRPERRPGRLGRVTLALGVSISGLALGQAIVQRPAPTAPRPGAGSVTAGAAFATGPMDRLQASVEAALQEAALQEAAQKTLTPPPVEEAAPASTAEVPLVEPCAPEPPETLPQLKRTTVVLGGAIAPDPEHWRDRPASR